MAKKLLEENTVRRFMKIAGLQPLSENFVEKLEEVEEADEAEKADEEKPMEEGYGSMPEADPTPESDMPSEEEMPELSDDLKAEILSAVADAIGAAEMVEMEPEEGEGEAEEEDVMEEGEHMPNGEKALSPDGDDLENPEKMDAASNAQPDADMSKAKEGAGEHMQESKEFTKKLVEQVAKRVAARLKNLK